MSFVPRPLTDEERAARDKHVRRSKTWLTIVAVGLAAAMGMMFVKLDPVGQATPAKFIIFGGGFLAYLVYHFSQMRKHDLFQKDEEAVTLQGYCWRPYHERVLHARWLSGGTTRLVFALEDDTFQAFLPWDFTDRKHYRTLRKTLRHNDAVRVTKGASSKILYRVESPDREAGVF